MKYGLYCVNNGVDERKIREGLCQFAEWVSIKSNTLIDIEYSIITIFEPVKWFYSKPYYGLDFYTTNRFNTDAVGNHAIVYFYDPVKMIAPFQAVEMASWTYLLDGRPQEQIICRPEFDADAIGRLLEHEGMHACFANLKTKGINLVDTVDEGGQMDLDDEWSILKVFAEKLCDPLPIDTFIGKLLILKDKLGELLAKLKGRRITFMQLAIAMAKFEGFYIAGSRAQRNHNQLNLKYVGQKLAISYDDKNFCIFKDDPDGWKAGTNDLKLKAGGIPGVKSTSGLNAESTIEQLIRVWTKGDPVGIQDAYIKFVCDTLEIIPSFRIGDLV